MNIKTIADWIKVKRMEKNLTPGHLAAKMGIATALLRSWEDGSSQPDSKQLEDLANYLGLPLVRIAELEVIGAPKRSSSRQSREAAHFPEIQNIR